MSAQRCDVVVVSADPQCAQYSIVRRKRRWEVAEVAVFCAVTAASSATTRTVTCAASLFVGSEHTSIASISSSAASVADEVTTPASCGNRARLGSGMLGCRRSLPF